MLITQVVEVLRVTSHLCVMCATFKPDNIAMQSHVTKKKCSAELFYIYYIPWWNLPFLQTMHSTWLSHCSIFLWKKKKISRTTIHCVWDKCRLSMFTYHMLSCVVQPYHNLSWPLDLHTVVKKMLSNGTLLWCNTRKLSLLFGLYCVKKKEWLHFIIGALNATSNEDIAVSHSYFYFNYFSLSHSEGPEGHCWDVNIIAFKKALGPVEDS